MNIADHVPRSILDLRTEANLDVINPRFASTFGTPGDVLEVGCFRGTLSLKYAFWLASLDSPKRVFALDTFSGFAIRDNSPGGARRIGDYNSEESAHQELLKWSHFVPITPIKGDATKVEVPCLSASFVWLDLDIAKLLDAACVNLKRVISPATLIGLDDYGRPDCPSVKPWADALERNSTWTKVDEGPAGTYIAFYRKTGDFY